MASQIPSVLFFESKLRIIKGMQLTYTIELAILEQKLKFGNVSQQIYDDTLTAINRDMQYLNRELEELTQLKHNNAA